MNNLMSKAEWIEGAPEDALELNALTQEELEDSFYTELSFGTAGLRGIIGAGTNRMNKYIVRRATQGLCDYLKSLGLVKKPVVIAYDSRRYSDLFALETALVCAKNGIHAYLFESLRAVPQLSFAVRELGCSAGVMVTASHNPAKYNGYKVYWSHGGQLGPEEAAEAYDFIKDAGYFKVKPMDEKEAIDKGLLTYIGRELDEKYYAATKTLLLNQQMLKQHGGMLNLVYTPLHGAGNVPVRELLKSVGVSKLYVVDRQEKPDPDFKTVSVPNPEDPGAYTLAIALADEVKADVILATDPDSDRLGVAVRKSDGEFVLLSGNQIGCLLIENILQSLSDQGRLKKNAFIVKSLVSSKLADAICDDYDVALDEVLTGFRFISEKIEEQQRLREREFIFGFEESNGYLAGSFSRDKDAICAAMLIAEACVYYALKGMTLYDALEGIYKKYGYYKEITKAYTLYGKQGIAQIAAAMESLRNEPIKSLNGHELICYEDYLTQKSVSYPQGGSAVIRLPKSDMLRMIFEGGAYVIIRPSGTEPKLKLYVGAMDAQKEQAESLIEKTLGEADAILSERLNKTDINMDN